nr:AmmeMemoRadiSam system radical SAM enzyme [Anaeromonas frigoriresistens]
MFYKRLDDDKVHCYLCPHNCLIKEGDLGKCSVRLNEEGSLFSTNYGQVTALSLDPIEKKPLKFFKPNSKILSVGSFGCNLTCSFCQNYSIAQFTDYHSHSQQVSVRELSDTVFNTSDNIGVAFTYNEPSIWYEYVFESAKLIKERDKNKSVVLVTNGFISEEPLKELLPFVDAMNIDLKAFSNEYYENICGGRINPVLKSIEIAAKECHVEVTTLLVTGENDNLEEIEDLSKFLGSIDRDIPLHLARYFPMYKMDNPPTNIDLMYEAKEIASKHLNNVVLGNV